MHTCEEKNYKIHFSHTGGKAEHGMGDSRRTERDSNINTDSFKRGGVFVFLHMQLNVKHLNLI